MSSAFAARIAAHQIIHADAVVSCAGSEAAFAGFSTLVRDEAQLIALPGNAQEIARRVSQQLNHRASPETWRSSVLDWSEREGVALAVVDVTVPGAPTARRYGAPVDSQITLSSRLR